MKRALLTMLGALALLIIPVNLAGAAEAADACNATVTDAGQLFGARLPEVQQAASKVESAGGYVRVVTTMNMAEVDIDHFVDNLQSQCSSWRGSNGLRKNNLVVVAISMTPDKHTAGIFNGSAWNTPLRDNNEWTRILTDSMKPQLGAGDFAGATVSGLNRIATDITNYLHPPAAVPSQSTVVSQPTDYSGLWPVLWGVLIVVVLAGGLIAFFVIRGRREDERDALATARQEAISAKTGAADLIVRLGSEADLAVLASKAKSYAGAGDRGRQVTQALATFRTEYDTASRLFSEAATGGDPEATDLALGVYDSLADQYGSIRSHAQAAEDARNTVNRLVGEIDDEVAGFPKALATADQTVVTVEAGLETLDEEGYRVQGLADSLDQIDLDLDAIRTDSAGISGIALVPLADRLAAVSVRLQKVADGAAGLRKAKAEAPGRLQAVQAQLAALKGYIGQHGRDISQSVKDEIPDLEAHLGSAQHELDSDRPEYLHLSGALGDAEAAIGQLTQRAQQQHQAAEALRAKARQALADAKEAVDEADGYIDRHSSDVNSGAEEKLREAKTKLAAAREAGSLSEVIRLAGEAEDKAKKAKSKAKDDVDEAEEARRPRSDNSNFGIGVGTGYVIGAGTGYHSGGDNGGGGGINFGGNDGGGGGGINIGGDGGGGGGINF